KKARTLYTYNFSTYERIDYLLRVLADATTSEELLKSLEELMIQGDPWSRIFAHKVLEDVAQNPEGALIQGVWKAFGQKRFIKSVAHYNRNGEVNSRLMNVKLSTDRIKKTMMNSLVNYGLDMTGNRISLEEEKAIIAEAERVYGLIGKRIYPGGIDVLWQNIGRHLALVGIDIANEDILKLKQGTFKGRSFNNQGITALLNLLRYRLNTL